MEEEGRVQEKGKGSGGSQIKQPLGEGRGGIPIPPPPLFLKNLSYILPRLSKQRRESI